MPIGSKELFNSRGFESYSAPCPKDLRVHKYRFRVFAMPNIHTSIITSSNFTSQDIDLQLKVSQTPSELQLIL